MKQIALGFSLGISLLTGSAINAIPSIAAQPSAQANAQLTRNQIVKLRSASVPIVVPQYVPLGFRVTDVSVDTLDRRFGPHYSINYKNAEDVCFSVMFTGGGVGGESYDYRLPIQTKLLGKLSLTFGSQVVRSAKRPSQSELNSRYPVLLTDWAQLPGTQRGYYNLQSEMAGAGEKAGCKTITPREAIRIAQSLTLLGERQTAANNKSAPTLARITFRTLYSDSAFGEFHQFKQSSQADASGIQFAASKQQSRQSLEEVEKTVRNLTDRYRQWVKDSENNSVSSGYLRDRRKPEQRAMLQNFITAWSSPEPVAAPFFGSWKGYESEITIYPSKHVSRVCVISTGEGTGRFDVGQVKRSTIHYQNRLLFRDNKYLGVFAALNGKLSLANDEVPYNNPNPLEEVSTFISRRVLDPSSRASIIKQFEQQDCITSLPQTLSSAATNTAEERSSLVKATVFNSVINQFRRTLTSDKALRLPLTIPAIYNKGVASIDGDRYVRIGRQAHCSNSCEYLSVSTSEPTQENLEWFRDHRNNNAESVDLRNDIVGFYDVNKDGSRGGAQNVMWQQDGKIIYLSMRLNSSRKEVIETARSMTSSQALISALPKPIDQISKTNSKCSADRIPVVIAPDRNRFPDGQTPSFAGRLGIYGDGKREDRTRIDPGTRCIFFREIANPSSARRTWLVIHGWLNNSQSTEIKELAEAVAKTNRNDRVLMLDWGEAAYNGGGNPLGIAQLSRGNYYAATWIRPVAEEAVNYLKNHYKINDEQAGSQLNLIGHSLGSLMSAEIGALYDQGVNALIALDPASEIDINDAIPGFNLGGYDVDGRTPAYSLNGILQIRSLNQGAVDRPRCFSNLTSTNAIKIADCNAGRRIARFSRAFVGKTSFAGNQSLAATADESFQIDFGERSDSPSSSNTIAREHGQVVKAFISRILGEGLIPTFLGIQDLSRHKDIKRDAYPYKLNPLSPSSPLWQFAHTGIITSSTDNAFTGFRLESLTKGKVSFSSIEYSTEDQNIYWENSTGRKIAGGSLLPGVFTLFSSIRPITTLVP